MGHCAALLIFQSDFVSLYTQGVMKVRKRVTLMILTVTAMFGICWLTEMIAHVVQNHSSYSMDKVVFTVTHTVILFNSAVNPFVYALINKNFREKIKTMLCFTGCTEVRVHPALEPQSIEIAPVTTPQINTAGPCSSEWCVHFIQNNSCFCLVSAFSVGNPYLLVFRVINDGCYFMEKLEDLHFHKRNTCVEKFKLVYFPS